MWGRGPEKEEPRGALCTRPGPAMHLLFALLVLAVAATAVPVPQLGENGFTPPFNRLLRVTSPPMSGNDVVIAQNLLTRFNDALNVSTVYDAATADVVRALQTAGGLAVDGELGVETSTLLLNRYLADGYVDATTFPLPHGFKYIAVVPVHANRSIETTATLYAANGTVLHTFTTRTHGQDDPATGLQLNALASNGATPTGLMTFDLNTPEPDPKDYGPYDVNRAPDGLKGNAAFILGGIRNGILLHTGEWDNWTPSQPMPNSHGCIHAHPADIKFIAQVLQSIGVVAHENPFGQRPYPFRPQGLLSVYVVPE